MDAEGDDVRVQRLSGGEIVFTKLVYRELKDVKLEVPCCTWKPKNALEKITRRRQCRLLSSKFTIPRGINALV